MKNADIDFKFRNLTKSKKMHHPRARTVGELIYLLGQLPCNLKVESETGLGVEVVVHDYGTKDVHAEFEGFAL